MVNQKIDHINYFYAKTPSLVKYKLGKYLKNKT
jgi:hypothetical protein